MAESSRRQRTFDVIVIGLGGMGSAASYHLAGRGRRVLGLERFTPAHNRGSSHGQSRIIRQAYFEHPAYVPLLRRAYELWQQLEYDCDAQLLRLDGGLLISPPESHIITGSLGSAREYNIPHVLLDTAELRRRYPVFQVDDGTIGLLEHTAGIIRPEASVGAHLRGAIARGAELHFEEQVERWEATAEHVRVITTRGEYEAERLVITPGPWAPDILGDLQLPLQVERNVQFWVRPPGSVEPFLPDRFPIFIWMVDPERVLYGFPSLDESGSVKVAFHHSGVHTTADTIDRQVQADEVERLRTLLAERIPALAGAVDATAPCMYTNTPDEHFVIAVHPRHPQVAIAAGFSGHGFKFCSVVGEILADLALEGRTEHPIGLFDPRRFTG
jgi:sarcosine oxidase